jgi:uncharacterized protein YecE (DUF72 family)
MSHPIRVGIGGWSFEPWNETFYPPGLSAKKQLPYMSRKLTAVEVNATYYSAFKPDTFARWADESPPGFVFSLKAHRFSTIRKTKEDMATSMGLFLDQGITELKDKLGPINWQFPPTRKFDPDWFTMFLSLLPKEKDGIELRHALEVRHPSCADPRFVELIGKFGATVVYAEDDDFPKIRDEAAPFVVARLMQSKSEEEAGYSKADITRIAKMAEGWAKTQDAYVFFISGAKERNPAAAMALQEKLGVTPETAGEADDLAVKKGAGKAAAPAKKAPAGKK